MKFEKAPAAIVSCNETTITGTTVAYANIPLVNLVSNDTGRWGGSNRPDQPTHQLPLAPVVFTILILWGIAVRGLVMGAIGSAYNSVTAEPAEAAAPAEVAASA